MKTKNLLPVMAFIAMLLVPSGALAYSSGDIDGTTGTGTRDDPVLVDTYSELVAAMNSSEIEYVTVTGNIDHYLTTSEIKNNEALMTLPRGKVLELNADVHIFNYIVDPLLYSCIEVDSPSVYFKINGNGHILSCQFNSSGNPNAVVYMQHGTVVIDNAYIRAVSTYSYAYALWSKNDAITTIYSGRFYGECNFLKTVTDAWGVVIDGGKVTIEDGIFQAKSEDGSAWGIRFDPGVSAGNVKISGGKFAGMDSHYTSNNISEFIADGCSLVKTTDGTAVSAATKEIKYIVQVVDPAKILKKVALTVSEPVGGASPAKGTITSTGAYIHEETWYDDNGNKMSATDKFEEGKKYQYRVMTYPKGSNYCFINNQTKATINGNAATILNSGTGSGYSDGFLYFQYTFTAKKEVKTIAVTVPEPVAGAEITSNLGTITSEGVTLTGSWWEDPNYVIYSTGGKFEEGKQYNYVPILMAKDGWQITANTQCTVNGKAATFLGQIFDGYLYAYLFDLGKANKDLTTIAVTVTEPAAGASPAKGTVTSEGAKIATENWYVVNGHEMSATDNFEQGKQYRYCVLAYPKAGYSITATTAATINGKASTVNGSGTGTYVSDYNTGYLNFEYTFDIPTGIVGVTNDAASADGPIFNLAGQRVGSSYKGIVIQNGKKVLKK